MKVSEVVDIEGSFGNSTAIKAGDQFTVQKFTIRNVESLGSDIVEIKTTEGLRHSFGKTVIGQAKSEYWCDVVEKCVSKDASDGLDVYVVEKEAEGTGRLMLALSMFPPKQ
jgi:hypothetical protein